MMLEDQIVARAQEIVAERREERNAPPRDGLRAKLLVGLILAILAAFLLYPAPMSQKLLMAMGGVCGLRPDHSYFVGSTQLPLEARMVGIYGGLSITLGWLLVCRRLGATRIGTRTVIALLGLMFLAMVADGVNSTFMEFGLPHPYTSTNITRIVTGLLSGVSIATILAWAVTFVARPRERRPMLLFASAGKLLVPIGLCTLLGLLVVSEQLWGYYPIAALSVGGIVLSLAATLLLPTLRIGGYSHCVTAPRQLLAPGALSLLLAFAVLAVLAALRWSTFGILV